VRAFPERWSLLALMRFFLASIVAVTHLSEHESLGAGWTLYGSAAFEAVLGFLVISGYSVGSSYLAAPHGFYMRRARRIYPIYVAATVLTLGVSSHPLSWAVAGEVALNLLFLNQLLTASSFVGPAWSLALEAWCYALAPLLARLTLRRATVVALGSFAAYLIYTCGRTLFHWPYFSGLAYGLDLPLLGYSWLLGLLLARDTASASSTLKLLGVVFGLHLALAFGIEFASKLSHHATERLWAEIPQYLFRGLTLAIVWLVLAAATARQALGIKREWMRFLGDVSYPLYLVHLSAYSLVWSMGVRNPYMALAAAFVLAAIIYWVIDFYSRARHRRADRIRQSQELGVSVAGQFRVP
jgi:peptidoglycan/LPS O-acetylase OafA/YrhL